MYQELLGRGATPMLEVRGGWSPAGFRRVCGAPAVLRGAANEWTCMSTWDFTYLKETFGDKISHVTEDGDHFEMWAVKRFVAALESKDPEFLMYMKDATWWHSTEMASHFETPQCFENWLASPALTDQHPRLGSPDYPAWSWLYIGPQGSSSPLHVDIFHSSAWNVVVKGKKLWIFFPQSERKCLQDDDEEFVDPFNPDFEKYPHFQSAQNAQIVIQNPGDIVFTPSGWYHAVLNLEAGIALTENFVNETNVFQVLSSLQIAQRGNKEPEMDLPIERVLTELRRLIEEKLVK